MEWISVKDRLPEPKKGIGSYECYGTGVVLVIHKDRPDYPVTAHAFLGESIGAGLAVSTNGKSKHKYIGWHSVGRDLSNPFYCVSNRDGKPFKDSAGYSVFLPSYFGAGITHWMPLPEPPKDA